MASPTIQFDTKTGAKLAPGQSTIVNGVSQQAGSAYTGANAYGSGSNVINYNTSNGQMLAPGASTTDALGNTYQQGQTFTPTSNIGSTDLNKTVNPIQPLSNFTNNNPDYYNSIITGTGAGAKTIQDQKIALQQAKDKASENTMASILQQSQDLFNSKPSEESLYKQAQDQTGIIQKQQAVSDLSGQLNQITAQSQANQLQVTGQGRGIPEAIIGGQQAQISREAAIQSLPVAAQLAAAQGNLAMAEQNLNTLFKIKSDDAAAKYDYQKTLISTVYDFASKQEKSQFDFIDKQLDTKLATQQADLKAGKDMIVNAMGQGASQSITSKALDVYNNGGSQLDVAKALGVYSGDYLGNQYKKMQIAEIAQKISDAKKVQDFSNIISPVTQNSDGTYNTSSQQALLSQMKPTDAALVQMVGTYKMDLSKITSLRSDQRQALAAKVALVYPGFDMTNYAAHAAYVKSLASTTQNSTGGTINSANKAINHLSEFIESVTSTNPGRLSSTLNAFRNTTAKPFSSKLQEYTSAANTAATGLKDELAKFFKGSSGDIQSIADWGKSVDPNSTPSQLRGTAQAAISLLEGQLVPMMDQYKQTMGVNPPEGLFLKLDTIAKLSDLKNQGYKINIPGVNYTDKTSWVKYGAGSQDQWNSAVDKLTQLGIPLSEENILQATQLQ